MLRSHPSTLLRLHDERGFTLIELLVAMIAGLVVSFAAFAILNTSLSQSTRIADRVSADQRGRIAMEKIMLELHSSCLAPGVTPVEPGSAETKLRIVSQTGAQPSFEAVKLHEISLVEEKPGKYKLVDASYPSTAEKKAPEWKFSGTAESTQTLLTGVTQSETSEKTAIPIFQYFKYEGSELSTTPLLGTLTETVAGEVAAITVSFTTAPESGTVGKTPGGRTVDLSDTAVLRFSPASTSGANSPCA